MTIARDAATGTLAVGGGRLSPWWTAAKLLALIAVLGAVARRRRAPALAALTTVPVGILVVSGPGVHRAVGQGVVAHLPGVAALAGWLGISAEAAGTFLTLAGLTGASVLLAAVVARLVEPSDRAVPGVLVAGMAALFLAAGGLDLLAALRGSSVIAGVEQAAERLVLSGLLAALAGLLVEVDRRRG